MCSGSQCSYTLTAEGRDVDFNTAYLVELTALNTCDFESSEDLNVTVVAYGKYLCIICLTFTVCVSLRV